MTQDEVNILVNKFKNGDDDAFTILINNTKEPLYKVIYGILQNQENTIDVLDEVIYKAYVYLKNLKHNEFFKTWIIRIAINESKNFIKKNSKILYVNKHEEKTDSTRIANEHLEERMDIENAMQKLDINTKLILIMKLYLEYTFDEIASSLQKPASTIKSSYYTRIRKIKKISKNRGR